MPTTHQIKTVVGELLGFITRVLVFWYLVAVFIELLLPGFVSNRINLDLFLWSGILSALFSLMIDHRALFRSRT